MRRHRERDHTAFKDDREPLGKKTPGVAGTHTGHTGTRIT